MTFENCGGPFALKPENMITCWESEPTTVAETSIIAFLKGRRDLYVGKQALHIGVGNCSLPSELLSGLGAYLGVTLSLPEEELFKTKFAGALAAKVVIANKYDPRTYHMIDGCYDLIIDVNLKSYACCEYHFRQLMAFYAESLSNEGILITTQSGLLWAWNGETKRAYTPGAQSDPSVAKERLLSVEDLRRLGDNLGLSIRSSTCVTNNHRGVPTSETLWFVGKPEALLKVES